MTRFNEESRKRPFGDADDDRQFKRSNYGSGKPLLKLLVPNFIAGKLIGKGGSNLSEIKSKFSASIQVSSNNEFYPGTEERIVTIATEKEQLKDFLSYMIETVQVDKESERGPLNTGNLDVKIVVTNVGAGLVIGKGGATIKAIKEESHAKVYLSKRDETNAESERVLVVSGSNEQRVAACCQIIENMSSEPEKMCTANIRYGASAMNTNSSNFSQNLPIYNNPPPPQETPSFLYNGVGNGQRQSIGIPRAPENNYSQSNYEPRSRAKFYGQMEIPDEMVGAILGKQGQTIKEIIQVSGAKVKFSAKDEYAPGTTDRILTIRGSMNQINTAYMLVDQKVAQVEHDINTGVFTRR